MTIDPKLSIQEYAPIGGETRWGVDTLLGGHADVFFTFDLAEAERFLKVWCPELRDYFKRSGMGPQQWWEAVKMAESLKIVSRVPLKETYRPDVVLYIERWLAKVALGSLKETYPDTALNVHYGNYVDPDKLGRDILAGYDDVLDRVNRDIAPPYENP